MKTKDSEWEKLRALEQSLWRAGTRLDRTLMEKTFAKDFYEIGRSGRIHTRQDCLELSPKPFEALLPRPNFRIRYIA
ncbi:nuclear transport factor 2 family protein, partial [Myxococcota bacterium]|nr:nuclear transport factor 2 family protein [Myxococcota bacterium]